MIKKAGNHTYFGTRSGTVFAPQWVVNAATEGFGAEVGGIKGGQYMPTQPIGEGEEMAPWGRDNFKPYRWLEMVSRSNIAPQLLLTLVNFACGERLYTYTEKLQLAASGDIGVMKTPTMPTPEVKRWLEDMKVEQLMRKRATDYYFAGTSFARMVGPRGNFRRNGITRIDHVDVTSGRCQKMSTRGRIENFYLCADWRQANLNSKKAATGIVKVPAFSQDNPGRHPASILMSKLYFPGQSYYGVQPWHAAENWIVFANRIPVWMNSNMTNSANIKYLVKWPASYFDYLNHLPAEEKEEKMDAFFDEVDAFLAGEHNVGKAFYTRQKFDAIAGKWEGWEIEPIKNDLQDKAWLENYKTSLGAMTGGFGVQPSLADIPLEGKFAISGSNLRIAYQMHIALKVSAAREIMLEPLVAAYRVNHRLGVKGFENPDLKFGFLNRDIVTLAENPRGMTGPNEETLDNEAANEP